MVSADALANQKEAASAVGIKEYLTKPVDFKKLIPVLIKYLRQDKADHPSEESLSTTPEYIDKQLLEKFTKISHLSILDGGQIMEYICEIQTLCQGFDSPYSEVITHIEDAVFNGDDEQLNLLVQEAIEKLT
jgi:YesN/AraC family two-component response regulator